MGHYDKEFERLLLESELQEKKKLSNSLIEFISNSDLHTLRFLTQLIDNIKELKALFTLIQNVR